jgi:ABC-type uncharacterized transport system ATPase component
VAVLQVTGYQFPSRTVDATALNNELTVSGSNYVQALGENGGAVTNINTINGEVSLYQCKCQR